VLDAWLEIGARLSLSVVAGAVIGLNRDLHNKPAGVRTHGLVSLGTALAVIVVLPPGEDLTQHHDALSRVVQGVVGREVRAAGDAEYGVDTLSLQAFHDCLNRSQSEPPFVWLKGRRV